MIKNSVIFICIFFVLAFFADEVLSEPVKEQSGSKLNTKISIVGMERNILGPITDIHSYSIDRLEQNPAIFTSRETHPLLAGSAALNFVRKAYYSQKNEDLKEARRFLDWLADSYPMVLYQGGAKIWQYNFRHNNLSPGWWSGMANGAIALAFRAGFEVFNDQKYKDNYEMAMEGIISSVENNGSSLTLTQDAQWICEYVWPDLTTKDSYFVLNGKLMALLAVRLMADVTDNKKYQIAYSHSLAGYKLLQENFFQKNDKWTNYMLNPTTAEAAHYAIYEIKLLDALFRVTQDTFFLEDIQRRKEIFKKSYPVYIQNDSLLFSTLGYPNPYYIDIYPVTIEFSDSNVVISSITSGLLTDKSIPLEQRAFLLGTVPEQKKKIDSITVKVFDGGQFIELYTGNINEFQYTWRDSEPSKPLYNLKCFYDAECKGVTEETGAKEVKIIPANVFQQDIPTYYANHQARLIFKLNEGIKWDEYKYFAFIVNSGIELANTKISLVDESGLNISRYYPDITSGEDNILLLSFVGFNEIDLLGDNLSEIQITLSTQKLASGLENNFNFLIKDFFLLKDNGALYTLLKDSHYRLIEKE